MQKQLNAVKEFHTAFTIGHSETPRADLGTSKNLLRYNLMKEENEEYLEAVQNNDIIEIADALGDMMYILFRHRCSANLFSNQSAVSMTSVLNGCSALASWATATVISSQVAVESNRTTSR